MFHSSQSVMNKECLCLISKNKKLKSRVLGFRKNPIFGNKIETPAQSRFAQFFFIGMVYFGWYLSSCIYFKHLIILLTTPSTPPPLSPMSNYKMVPCNQLTLKHKETKGELSLLFKAIYYMDKNNF